MFFNLFRRFFERTNVELDRILEVRKFAMLRSFGSRGLIGSYKYMRSLGARQRMRTDRHYFFSNYVQDFDYRSLGSRQIPSMGKKPGQVHSLIAHRHYFSNSEKSLCKFDKIL